MMAHHPPEFTAQHLRLDDQRADHAGAGGFVGVWVAVEGIPPGLRGLEQRHVALAGRYDRMHVELVDVKVMGRGVGVVEPQRHGLADPGSDFGLVEQVILGREHWECGQRFWAETGGYAMWLDRSRQDTTEKERGEG